jgi:TRAP-type mannitol/chloroaromatic compound transport system permease small subunit
MSEKIISLFCRVFFFVSFVFLALSIMESVARRMGYTILRHTFEPARLLEYAVILLVFVMAMLLRQIRNGTRTA